MSKKTDTPKPIAVRDYSYRVMRPKRKPKQHPGQTGRVGSIRMTKGVWCDQTGKRMMLADDHVWQFEEGQADLDFPLDTPGTEQMEASSCNDQPQKLLSSPKIFADELNIRKTRGDSYDWGAAIAHCDRKIEAQGYPLACIDRFLRREIEEFFEKNSVNGFGPSSDWIRRKVQKDRRFKKYQRR